MKNFDMFLSAPADSSNSTARPMTAFEKDCVSYWERTLGRSAAEAARTPQRLNISEPVQREDGCAAEIINVLPPGKGVEKNDLRIIARCVNKQGGSYISAFLMDGTGSGTHCRLVNVPPPAPPKPKAITVWMNVYVYDTVRGCGPISRGYLSRADADRNASQDRFACVKVDVVEGDGLECFGKES